MIKHLLFLKILNMMDIKEVYHQWFINFLIKRLLIVIIIIIIIIIITTIIIIIIINKYFYRANSSVVILYIKLYPIYTVLSWKCFWWCCRKWSYSAPAEKPRKPIVRKLGKRKVHSSLIDNVWGADIADMQLLGKFNKGIYFALCVTDIYSKHP